MKTTLEQTERELIKTKKRLERANLLFAVLMGMFCVSAVFLAIESLFGGYL